MNDNCCKSDGKGGDESIRAAIEEVLGPEPERERFTQTEELTRLLELMAASQPTGTGFILLKHLRRISERIDMVMADVRHVNDYCGKEVITLVCDSLEKGYALDLDGVDDYLDLGTNPSMSIPDNGTITAWIKPILPGPNNQSWIFASLDGVENPRDFTEEEEKNLDAD